MGLQNFACGWLDSAVCPQAEDVHSVCGMHPRYLSRKLYHLCNVHWWLQEALSRTALIHLFKPAIQSASLNKAKNPFILILPPFHMSSSVLWSCGKKGFIKFYNLTKTSKFWGVSAHASNRYSDAPPSKTLKASAWNEAWKLVRIHQTDITMLHLQKHWNPLYGRNHRC